MSDSVKQHGNTGKKNASKADSKKNSAERVTVGFPMGTGDRVLAKARRKGLRPSQWLRDTVLAALDVPDPMPAHYPGCSLGDECTCDAVDDRDRGEE
jgi:hypothetical protein